MTTTAERSAPWQAGRSWRRFLVLLPVIALVLGAALWWWSHPRAFGGYGGQVGAVTEVGETRFFGLGHPPRDLEILEVRPLVASDDADATVGAVVCVGAATRGGIGVGDSEMASESCGSVREAGGPLTPDDHLLIEVRGTAPGTVVVEGVAVTYRDGVQRGAEVLDVDIGVGVGLGIGIEDFEW